MFEHGCHAGLLFNCIICMRNESSPIKKLCKSPRGCIGLDSQKIRMNRIIILLSLSFCLLVFFPSLLNRIVSFVRIAFLDYFSAFFEGSYSVS